MRAIVQGGSGYTGGELLRLLAGTRTSRWPRSPPSACAASRSPPSIPSSATGTSSASAASTIWSRGRRLLGAAPRPDRAAHRPHPGPGPVVVDLSADFRLHDPADYPRWYGWEHPRPELLSSFVYGLAELHREQIVTADRLAIGGCVATASILALAPFVRAGWSTRPCRSWSTP